jgi:hypothetical protein
MQMIEDLTSLAASKPWIAIGGLITCVLLGSSAFRSGTKVVTIEKNIVPFEAKNILSDRKESYYEGKDARLAAHTKELLESNDNLKQSLKDLKERLSSLENSKKAEAKSSSQNGASKESQSGANFYAPDWTGKNKTNKNVKSKLKAVPTLGPASIHFPVANKPVNNSKKQVNIPVGSYVKGTLMTGIEAPEGKTLPVLLQLDHAMIGPNQTNLDLSGCFIIAKASGDLSTERVQMQATKLSCVSPGGELFERSVNGFVADDKDNGFAVIGKVNSKRMRSAGMAFFSSVVEGVGSSIQDRQSEISVGTGGITKSITGNRGKYLAAGGAANAASKVTDWYLKQADNLLPTINVGSGQEIWIVMHDSVQIPSHFFEEHSVITKPEEASHADNQDFFTRDLSDNGIDIQ